MQPQLHHLGTEYDRLGKACMITEDPPVEAVCLACGARTTAEDLLNAEVFSYALTSLGLAATRRGALLDGDDEYLFVDGANLYRRTVILEFLNHEIGRLRHFSSQFSVLLAECPLGPINKGVNSRFRGRPLCANVCAKWIWSAS
jgi:hypothetical protein